MAIALSPKLRLAPVWPALAALVVVSFVTVALLPGAVAEDEARDLERTLELLLPALPVPPAGATAPDPELERRLAALAAGTGYRLTLIARDGTVLADSARSFEQVRAMENHLDRPEVAGALARGSGRNVRRSDTTGEPTAYAARLVAGGEGPPRIARLGRPLASLARLRLRLDRALLLAALVALAVALAVSFWFVRSLFDPLSRLIRAAGRIGDGDYRVAIEIPRQAELASLARALERIQREAERQLAAVEAERDHLSATVASMSEGVVVVDARGRARLVNPAFRSLFAVDPATVADAALELAREPRLGDLVAEVLRRREPATIEIERLEPEPRTIALLASPLAGAHGAVVIARDLTEAERLNRVRRDFVANVSHELKTPLAAIRGYAETLVDGAVDEPATALRFSRRILEQCRRLGDLLADLLTLSRLESASGPRPRGPVDLREVAAEAVELVGAAAAAGSVAIELEPGDSPVVEGDRDALLRLAANLLDNAVKYNRTGGTVRVRVSARGGEAALEVTDTGIGISAAHLGRIFERFYRVDAGRAREEGGTGLGLAIVKHVAQSHEGRVEVESEPGRGSTFRVLLPPVR